MRGKLSLVDFAKRSDESFRYISLREWYSSAMPLLQTPHRTALLSGLLHSVGSQVASVASVAFDALKGYLLSTSDTGVLLEKVLGDLRVILSANLGTRSCFNSSFVLVHSKAATRPPAEVPVMTRGSRSASRKALMTPKLKMHINLGDGVALGA